MHYLRQTFVIGIVHDSFYGIQRAVYQFFYHQAFHGRQIDLGPGNDSVRIRGFKSSGIVISRIALYQNGLVSHFLRYLKARFDQIFGDVLALQLRLYRNG